MCLKVPCVVLFFKHALIGTNRATLPPLYQVDAYTLPAFRSSIRDESGFYLSDDAVSTKIGLIDDDGDEVGEIDGILMKF